MAEKRGKKKQAHRPTQPKTPSWVLLLLGGAVTAIVLIFMPRLLKQGPAHFLHIHKNNQASAADDSPKVIPPKKTPLPVTQRAQTEYDFYTVLPNKRIHTEAKPQSRIITTDNSPAQRVGAPTTLSAEQQTNRTVPHPTGSSPSAHPLLNVGINAVQSTQPASSVAQSPNHSSTDHLTPLHFSQHYMLQVGAFGGPADAESTKARLALLGIHAHVESALIGENKTIYRVRIGPYQTSKELSETRQKLADSGVRAIAIELH